MFTPDQVRRYSRHMLMPEVGAEGQLKLLDAKVLMIGAGGLGSPSAYYLAAAGVGTIGLVDHDVVDESNLQRQILHDVERVGTPKVDSARQTLEGLNPDMNVITYDEVINSENAMRLIADYDIVVNGCDNFPTRYLVNDACVLLGKPMVDGSVLKFDGMVTVFMPGKGCYRCMYPAPPPPELAPNCAEAGVLGVVPGVIGVLQATEVVKLIIGIGDILESRLLTWDALEMEFITYKRARKDDCPVCGDEPSITELIDYEQFCGMPAPSKEEAEVSAV
ncbi:MAG: molybdopterin-synthase adenylyltransferase MoeB [Chloroflexota bacterium]|nr:molybdopterin-synthase adenylyltransferase MoeB [Chloroflexota bacterium]